MTFLTVDILAREIDSEATPFLAGFCCLFDKAIAFILYILPISVVELMFFDFIVFLLAITGFLTGMTLIFDFLRSGSRVDLYRAVLLAVLLFESFAFF